MRRSRFLLLDPALGFENGSSRDDSEEVLLAGGSNLSDLLDPSPPPSSRTSSRMKLPGVGPDDNSAFHWGKVTNEWLSQADDARMHGASEGLHSILNGRKTPKGQDVGGGLEDFSSSVIEDFNYWRRKPELAEAVAAIKALIAVIKRSEATTMMGLEIDLKRASEVLKASDKTSISLSAGCDLFMRYVTRTSALEYEDIAAGKARLTERGETFGEISMKSRQTIADLGQEFVHDDSVILTHGFSRVVLSLLKVAADKGKRFSVVCTEGRPDNTGLEMARELSQANIQFKLILDSGVAYNMEKVDMVLIGAEGVVESGGIINYIGTYQTALVASCMNKPVYVAAESYKFARLYPLDQTDMLPAPRLVDLALPVPNGAKLETSARDYTPPQYLSLLFTDLGILTPSAVSDELIQLYL